MTSAYGSMNISKIISIIQIILGIIGVVLLFTTDFAGYSRDVYYYYDWDTGVTHYVSHSYSVYVTENSTLLSVASVIVVLFVLVAIIGLFGVLPSGQAFAKYAKLTPLLGVIITVLGAIAGAIFPFVLSEERVTAWWLGTAFFCVVVGGVLFVVIGLISRRTMRTAAPSFPPPPPPPPPPP